MNVCVFIALSASILLVPGTVKLRP